MSDAEQAMVAVLEQLERRLQQAKASFDTGRKSGREGAVIAVGAAIEFIQGVDRLRQQNLEIPLASLMAALEDLNDGKQAKIIAPTKFGNRPPNDRLTRSIHAYAAATLELLMRLEFRRDAAAKDVVRVLQRERYRFGQHRGNPANTVVSWRDRLNSKNANHKVDPFMLHQYRDLLASVSFASTDREALRRDLLARLGHLVKSFRPADRNNA